jgi:hypothetical protein
MISQYRFTAAFPRRVFGKRDFDFFLILLPQRVSTDDGFCRGLGYRSHLFRRDWRNPQARLFGGFAPDFPHYISGKEFKKMKTFIVYDLDSQMPVAVGEQVSAETARYCASVATGIFQANLLAEEIDLEKQITY